MRNSGHCTRVHLANLMEWATAPLWERRALPTGAFTSRSVEVSELRLWVVTVNDQYAATELDPYPVDLAALAAAEQVTREPDTRGIYRTWVPDREYPRE